MNSLLYSNRSLEIVVVGDWVFALASRTDFRQSEITHLMSVLPSTGDHAESRAAPSRDAADTADTAILRTLFLVALGTAVVAYVVSRYVRSSEDDLDGSLEDDSEPSDSESDVDEE